MTPPCSGTQSNNDAKMSMSEQRAASAFNVKAKRSSWQSGHAQTSRAWSALSEDPERQDGADQVQGPVHDAENGGRYAGVVLLATEVTVIVERFGQQRDTSRQVQGARHQVEQNLKGGARQERRRCEGPAGRDQQQEGAEQAAERHQQKVELMARKVHLAVLGVVQHKTEADGPEHCFEDLEGSVYIAGVSRVDHHRRAACGRHSGHRHGVRHFY